MSNTPTPPPPAVIGSGKAHTVSLKPGSNVATRETARPRDEDKNPDLTARLMATLRRGEEASAAKRGVAPVETAPQTPTPTDTEADATGASLMGLSAANKQRLAQLRQSNEAVRGNFDRLPTAGRRAR
ncbi:MAG: hypothetical protein RI884_1961 [Pseudomonadota bacterium]|jgi:hypothetical protein